MKIDIRKLNAKKSYFGEMEFSYPIPEELMAIPFVVFDGPAKISFSYDLYEDDSLEIRGTVTYRLKGQCSRCLQDAQLTVVGELEAYFEPKKDAEDYSYFGGIVDITKAVEDAIMVSLPYTLSCGEECEGLSFSGETDQIEE